MAGLAAAPGALATTEIRVQARNNTGVPADDFHFEVDNSGGGPVGLRRLTARPIATLSIEAQERHERMERVHRDD